MIALLSSSSSWTSTIQSNFRSLAKFINFLTWLSERIDKINKIQSAWYILLSSIWYSSIIKSFLNIGKLVFFLTRETWSIFPKKYLDSVSIDKALTPDFS